MVGPFKNKLLRNKPSPLTPEAIYLSGRATADLDQWRKAVPTVLEQPVKQGGSESQCPYPFGDQTCKVARADWLRGFYDELVDQTELRCRKALGLPPINWQPPPDPVKAPRPTGGPG